MFTIIAGTHDLCYMCHGRGVKSCHYCKGGGKKVIIHDCSSAWSENSSRNYRMVSVSDYDNMGNSRCAELVVGAAVCGRLRS